MRKTLVLALCLAAMLLGCQKKPQVRPASMGPVGSAAPAPRTAARPTPPRIEPVGPPRPADHSASGPMFKPVRGSALTPVTPAPAARRLPPVSTAKPLPPVPVTPPPAAVPGQRTYMVKNRDTLWSIAVRELGSGQRHKEILALNPGIQPTKLKVGQPLILPAR